MTGPKQRNRRVGLAAKWHAALDRDPQLQITGEGDERMVLRLGSIYPYRLAVDRRVSQSVTIGEARVDVFLALELPSR